MHKMMVDEIVSACRKKFADGDCATANHFTAEQLEDAIIELAASSKTQPVSPSILKRYVMQIISYDEWCKKERLPKDQYSRAMYNHWKRSLPRVQSVIDDIANGYLTRAHEELGRFLRAFDGPVT